MTGGTRGCGGCRRLPRWRNNRYIYISYPLAKTRLASGGSLARVGVPWLASAVGSRDPPIFAFGVIEGGPTRTWHGHAGIPSRDGRTGPGRGGLAQFLVSLRANAGVSAPRGRHVSRRTSWTMRPREGGPSCLLCLVSSFFGQTPEEGKRKRRCCCRVANR